MSIKKILYFKYVSIVLLYVRYSFALFLNMSPMCQWSFRLTSIDHHRHRSSHMVHFKNSYIIAHVEFVFLLTTIINSIIRTRC